MTYNCLQCGSKRTQVRAIREKWSLNPKRGRVFPRRRRWFCAVTCTMGHRTVFRRHALTRQQRLLLGATR